MLAAAVEILWAANLAVRYELGRLFARIMRLFRVGQAAPEPEPLEPPLPLEPQAQLALGADAGCMSQTELWLEWETNFFFFNKPHVCPEPVLANGRFRARARRQMKNVQSVSQV